MAAALGVLAVAAVAGAGGWTLYQRQAASEPVRLTSARPPLRIAAPAPPAPLELQARLETLAKAYREPVGIAVTDVTARWTAQVDGWSVFPQQSVSKLWVALAVMQAVDRKTMALDQPLTLTADDRSVFYQPITRHIRGQAGYATTVYDLLRAQLTESDNAANDKLIEVVGGPRVVTRTLAEKGLSDLGSGETERDLQTRTAGLTWKPEYGFTWVFKAAREQLPDTVRDAALADYLARPADGAKPAAITDALAALKRNELLSPGSTEVMLDLMGQCRTGTSRLRAGLPGDWTIAHKTGTGPDWRGASVGINDVGLISAPDGHTYAVAVMIRETRKPVHARQVLFQAVSRAVVDYWRQAPPSAPAPAQRVAAAASSGVSGVAR